MVSVYHYRAHRRRVVGTQSGSSLPSPSTSISASSNAGTSTSIAANTITNTTATATTSTTTSRKLDPVSASASKRDAAPLLQAKRKLASLYPPRPIPNSYWATPTLLACEYPWDPHTAQAPKLDALLRAGVRTFIDLTECGELRPYSTVLAARCAVVGVDPREVEYARFPIRDRCLPSSLAQMRAVMAYLRECAARGRVVAVHCRGGIGRTGMVVGCWLVESGVARDGREALAIIEREWKGVEKCTRYPCSPETGAQVEYVRTFHPSEAEAVGLKGTLEEVTGVA